jgi:hypothetical protein
MAYRVPIVSLEVDPDGIFNKHKCGINCNGSVEAVVHSLDVLLNNKAMREEISISAYEYIKHNHSTASIEKQMTDFFSNIDLIKNNTMKWSNYSFNRVFEEKYAGLMRK